VRVASGDGRPVSLAGGDQRREETVTPIGEDLLPDLRCEHIGKMESALVVSGELERNNVIHQQPGVFPASCSELGVLLD